MPAVAEDIKAAETDELETTATTPVVTTLYDLIAALNDQAEPWEEDVVTAAVVDLCNTGHLKFLNVSKDCEIVCA